MVWCFFPDKPPAEVKAKGATGTKNQLFLDKQNNPYGFAVGLKDVACKEPGCCCIATLGAPCGCTALPTASKRTLQPDPNTVSSPRHRCTACWARKAVLEKYAGGVDNYTCLQNYIPKCCCITTADMCKGSMLGLILEGCCCPMFSLSIARIHLMDMKQVQPDPCDWQIIACSNCLQCIACILDIIAIFVSACPVTHAGSE